MKRQLLLLPVLVLLFSYSSCKKVSEDIKRDAIIKDSVDFDIPVLSAVDEAFTLEGIKLPLNPGSAIAAQLPGFSEQDITSIKLLSSSIILVLGKDEKIDKENHFGNFQSFRFLIPDNTNTEKTPLLIATATINSPSENKNVSMTPDTNLELKPYLGASTENSTVIIRTRKVTTKILKARIRASFTVTVQK